jgi:hypothetical protein
LGIFKAECFSGIPKVFEYLNSESMIASNLGKNADYEEFTLNKLQQKEREKDL